MDGTDIEQACQRVERGLADFAASPQRFHALQDAMVTQQWLRRQYQAGPQPFQDYVSRLKALGQALRGALRQAQDRLVEEYLKANQAIEAWEQRRQACREALMELTRTEGIAEFAAASGQVRVVPSRALRLPPADSPERGQMMDLLEQAGMLRSVCLPNPTRLLKAVEGGRFSPEQAARLAQLCPIEQTLRVIGRMNSGSPASSRTKNAGAQEEGSDGEPSA